MGRIARFQILWFMAWRNLFSHRGKNLLVGIILFFGAFLVVVGSALLDSMDRSMEKSITSSLAGHLQVYSKKGKDDLALFGSGFMGADDIGNIADFARVKEVVLADSNVRAIIPMGIDDAEFFMATEIDHAIERLRSAMKASDERRIESVSGRIRSMAELMKAEFVTRLKIMKNKDEVAMQLVDIERAIAPALWADLKDHPNEVIEFLDTKIAPLVDENEGAFLRYLGTDIDQFVRSFSQFELVRGQMIPTGKQGLLLNHKFHEDAVRNRVAREIDALRREVVERKKKIAKDRTLQHRVERLSRQYRRITFQLEPDQAALLGQRLQEILPGAKGNIDELLQQFLKLDDANFEQRYRFFFEVIAPMIRLYLFDVGDVITIRTYTRSGYVKSVNLKVYGVFRFKGLEKSDLAGSHNLIDMITFRNLYGFMTKEKQQELQQIQGTVGLKDVRREDAEAALFGAEGGVETQKKNQLGFDEFAGVDLGRARVEDSGVVVDQAAIDHGIALNAAIILKDPQKLKETQQRIAAALDRAGLDLKVVDWQKASGMVGQMVILVRVVLYIAVFIIFLVALVIINNTMIMATMERIMEIGTMRAIGAQSRFVLALFLLETVSLGLVVGLIGSGLGAGLVLALGRLGLPAPNDIMVFFFSGPRLYPQVGIGNFLGGVGVILVVSLVSTFYPAFLATRIQPVVAMQSKE